MVEKGAGREKPETEAKLLAVDGGWRRCGPRALVWTLELGSLNKVSSVLALSAGDETGTSPTRLRPRPVAQEPTYPARRTISQLEPRVAER